MEEDYKNFTERMHSFEETLEIPEDADERSNALAHFGIDSENEDS